MWKIELGAKVRDKITGFEGIVVARTEWLNGCKRFTIQPQSLKDGRPVDTYAIDIEQAELISPPAHEEHKPSGGPMPEPSRETDPSR